MANELTYTIVDNYSKGGIVDAAQTGTVNVTITGTKIARIIDTATLAGNNLSLAGCTVPCYILIKNLDATNFITVGVAASMPVRVDAGKSAFFMFASAITPYVKADTADCRIDYRLFEA